MQKNGKKWLKIRSQRSIVTSRTENNTRTKEINNMKKFEVGKEYKTRSAYDHNYYNTALVLKRTAKMVTVIDDLKREIKCKIHTDKNGNEFIKTCKCSTVFA